MIDIIIESILLNICILFINIVLIICTFETNNHDRLFILYIIMIIGTYICIYLRLYYEKIKLIKNKEINISKNGDIL